MKQSEFNKLILFQPDAEPFDCLRDIVEAWFANELGEDAYQEPAAKYMEAIRARFVTEEGV